MKLYSKVFLLLILHFFLFTSCKEESPNEPIVSDIELGVIVLNQEGILEDISADIIIRIEIPSGVEIVDSVLTIISLDESNNSKGEIGKLFDNGILSNGDDIGGDNIYSGIINFLETDQGIVKLQVIGNVITSKGEGKGLSQVKNLNIYSNVSKVEYSEVVNTIDSSLSKFEEFLSGNISNIQSALLSTSNWLSTQPGITNVSNQSDNGLEIQFDTGLFGSILFSEEDENGSTITRGGFTSSSIRRKTKSISIANQTIGKTSNKPSRLNKNTNIEAIDPDIIGNKNVLIYAPFESAFAPHNERAKIIANLKKSEFKFQITSLVNQKATVSSLQNLTRYGLVVLATHGAGGKIFFTGEIVDTTLNIWKTSYKALCSSGKIGISGRLTISKNGNIKRKEKVYYIRPTFISTLAGKFPNSVILNNSCEGTKSASLQNAFISKGAKAYYGYSKIVNSDFCVTIADSVSKRLAVDFKNTAETYLDWTDPNSPNAKFEYKKGTHNVHYALNLVNGDFEFGNLDGWTIEGDGRNISKLGSLTPPEGKYLGIISTGLGFTKSTGKIFQSFRVEDDQSKITLKWNFMSEEFLEFINSSFQDFFIVKIIDKDGNEDVLINRTIDIIANNFGAKEFTNKENEVPQPGSLIKLSPEIVFDKGDVYMTGWQTFTFDVSNYRKQIITLVISAGDVGDSSFDTVILLDDISIK